MQDVSFSGLFLVTAVAFASPILAGLVPRLRLPDPVLEIVLGILIGPAVLGWVSVDGPIRILSQIGLAFLLFLAGFEIDYHELHGRMPRIAALAFAFSLMLAVVAGLGLAAGGLVETPLIVAVILVATSLGLVVPVLKDAGFARTEFGQLALAGASIAEFGAVVLLSLLFSTHQATGTGTKVLLLAGVAALTLLVARVLARAGRSVRVSGVLVRLQDTTAQIRIRAAMLLLLGFVALVEGLGQEAILGAFIAGGILKIVDQDMVRAHPMFRIKLDALGYGFLIPVFFVTSGLTFDLAALADGPALARVPVFLVVLLLVRGVPAFLYRRLVGGRRALAAGFLQATSLTFIVAAAQIGRSLGRLGSETAAALIAAGLLSVILFPPSALGLLRRREETRDRDAPG
ncbi:MAG: cation:proton antiporter [Actinomycetota bacterium]